VHDFVSSMVICHCQILQSYQDKVDLPRISIGRNVFAGTRTSIELLVVEASGGSNRQDTGSKRSSGDNLSIHQGFMVRSVGATGQVEYRGSIGESGMGTLHLLVAILESDVVSLKTQSSSTYSAFKPSQAVNVASGVNFVSSHCSVGAPRSKWDD
jgi:hypothetical protein